MPKDFTDATGVDVDMVFLSPGPAFGIVLVAIVIIQVGAERMPRLPFR
ncbi:hypothetical protein [Pseudorhodobacter turbinis]|nr:hypothetical protein [Pseudorhodobacter turbinis]